MIDCFDRYNKEENDKDCNIKFLLDNEDLACLLTGGCLMKDINGTTIKVELDM